MSVFGGYFWKCTAERAIKAFAQSLVALLSASSLGLLDVNWVATLSTAAMATLLSVLTSVAGTRIGPDNGPSYVATKPRDDVEPALAG